MHPSNYAHMYIHELDVMCAYIYIYIYIFMCCLRTYPFAGQNQLDHKEALNVLTDMLLKPRLRYGRFVHAHPGTSCSGEARLD